ncbi:MAG TPA: molybdopterin-dependent oxidoreductase [Thermomicrobiales bacterium]|nr:molybdopterin-dependent oxidoreductase [Thermomicrobiales bacterium]
MATRAETKMVTGKINGLDVTVPAGTTILEAARMANIEVPNLCYQPLMRPWGSCRICTVEILGKRGGLIESCATPLGEGMEVLTHSEPVEDARQFILQMYLIDHALDCPTCDKSGECYLQDNTYLNNVNTNPYRRPKFAHPYVHFSDTIDYKFDRCIMCNRCTRVCDEMIGVTAIESTSRSIEAAISPAFGLELKDTLCTNCGMCIAVCPVGALTDRHFAHHPWDLDTTETICGFCDNGCTINVESNKGIVRRATNLWERGTNHGYLCEKGKWGHELQQSPDRLRYPRINQPGTFGYEVTWDDALDSIAGVLANYQGNQFAALISADNTNEDAYLAQKFTRAVMGTNNVDRMLTGAQVAVERSVRAALGRDVASTNNLQEMFTSVNAAMVVGPDIGKTSPVTSYWLYHSIIYREAKIVVISQDDYPLGWRAKLWLKPNEGSTGTLLKGIARQIIDLKLNAGGIGQSELARLTESLSEYDLDKVARSTGVSGDQIQAAAVLYATGGVGLDTKVEDGYPSSVIFNTAAHVGSALTSGSYDNAAEITDVCNDLALLTGNFGRPGGGVATPRGPANYQGATDMGVHPSFLPGGRAIADDSARAEIEQLWGVAPPAQPGYAVDEIAGAIEVGEVKALYIESTFAQECENNPELLAALPKLDFLIYAGAFDSPIAQMADVVLPRALSLEVDGTFTSYDRTVQRVRSAVPAAGEARSTGAIVSELAQRMGYEIDWLPVASVMDEIGSIVPEYGGVTFARLERDGLNVPARSYADPGASILIPGPDGLASLSPAFVSMAAD